MKVIPLQNRDWKMINHDSLTNNLSWRDIQKKYKLSSKGLSKAKKLGLFKSLSHADAMKVRPRILNPTFIRTKQWKERMSVIKKKFHSEHPNYQSGWNGKAQRSHPCEAVKSMLRKNGIDFIEEFQALRPIRFYAIDIAFPNKKIGIEINGNHHYGIDQELKPYYQERHNLLVSHGWTIHEVHYKKAYDFNYILSLTH
jgi:very-short-patch-repair endonuclease